MLSNVKSFFAKLRTLVLWGCLVLLLSGCVKYDVGVTFDSQHSGEIVQTVRLGDRLSALNDASAQQWVDRLEARARKLKGNAKRLSQQELQVTIPFTTGKDFEQKFNQFFRGMGKQAQAMPDVNAAIQLKQANFLLAVRNHLRLDVDLRSLGIISDDEAVVVNPGSLLDLEFRLNGVAPSAAAPGSQGVVGQPVPGGMVWRLQPGQVNHIETTFWMVSGLGISTVLLMGAIATALYYKQTQKPSRSSPVPNLASPRQSSQP